MEDERYAQVLKMLGNGRVEVFCFAEVAKDEDVQRVHNKNSGDGSGSALMQQGVKRLGIIRGKMRKRVWITVGDFVLVSLREFQDNKCDIVHKYQSTEARSLRSYNELPVGGVSF